MRNRTEVRNLFTIKPVLHEDVTVRVLGPIRNTAPPISGESSNFASSDGAHGKQRGYKRFLWKLTIFGARLLIAMRCMIQDKTIR